MGTTGTDRPGELHLDGGRDVSPKVEPRSVLAFRDMPPGNVDFFDNQITNPGA